MYRPKFCTECGGKIVRLRWHLWTSRRFCERCSPRFRKERAIQTAVASGAGLALGIAIGQAARSAPPPLLIQRTQDLGPLSSSMPPVAPEASGAAAVNAGGLAVTAANSPAPLAEEIYMCGARTKKGTPCTRRVHGLVRCWQHKGLPAMLAPEKLRIRE